MKEVNFKTAFKYPFNRPVGMLNILWILLPIFGWFALGGYGVRIVKEFIKGKYKELPKMSFGSDMKLGFTLFIKAIPFIVAYIVLSVILDNIPYIGQTALFVVELFVVPILAINFVQKQTVASYFEFDLVRVVFENFVEYLFVLLRTIGLFLIYFVMCIVLVGFPALAFTQQIFLADFYRRYVVKK